MKLGWISAVSILLAATLPARADCGKGAPLSAAMTACVGQQVAVFFLNSHAQIEGNVVDASDQSITIENPGAGGLTNRIIVPFGAVLYFEWQHH